MTICNISGIETVKSKEIAQRAKGKASEWPSFWCECGERSCLPCGSCLWLRPRKVGSERVWSLEVKLTIRKRKRGMCKNGGRRAKKLALFPTSQWHSHTTPPFPRFIVTLSFYHYPSLLLSRHTSNIFLFLWLKYMSFLFWNIVIFYFIFRKKKIFFLVNKKNIYFWFW